MQIKVTKKVLLPNRKLGRTFHVWEDWKSDILPINGVRLERKRIGDGKYTDYAVFTDFSKFCEWAIENKYSY